MVCQLQCWKIRRELANQDWRDEILCGVGLLQMLKEKKQKPLFEALEKMKGGELLVIPIEWTHI